MKLKIVVFVSLVATIAIIGVIIKTTTSKPPVAEVMKAGKMLAEAQLEKSPAFAEEVFHLGRMYYDSAMLEWNAQNKKSILFRNYSKVSAFAVKSINSSEKAINTARKTISGTEDFLKIRIEKTGLRIDGFEESFGSFPLSKNHRDDLVRYVLMYSESLQSFYNKDYSICNSKLDSVEVFLNNVFAHYQEKLTDYYKNYPKWNEMVTYTIAYSKKSQTYVVIVDKMARQLLIYKSGKILSCYPIELGSNWVGNKIQQGDKSTPEGLYRIIDKKQNGQTKYYKAFLLDYPNEEDQKRFSLNKKNGIIDPDGNIGNLIEIHGNGGTGIDWTDGCIALKNSDMDKIYKLCPVGTKVTIVGSIKTLNELSVNLL